MQAEPTWWLFVCGQCELPLCPSSLVISEKWDTGLSGHAFAYELEDVLDVPGGIWCYNCSEEITTTAAVADGPLAATGASFTGVTSRRIDLVRVRCDGLVGGTATERFAFTPVNDASSVGEGTEARPASVVEQTRSGADGSWFTDCLARAKVDCSGCGCHVGYTFEHAPTQDRFAALMLQAVRQREWSPLDVVAACRRDRVSHQNPDQDELQLRVLSLKAQTSLYVDLLSKHKEQSDVQRQLLSSQKDRIVAHEEKICTLQQIVEAQRHQLEMQAKHMKYQEDLLTNQREQISTQQQQIEVEQLLLCEQNKTIHSQLDQMRVMQAHLRAKDERIRIETELRLLREQQSKIDLSQRESS